MIGIENAPIDIDIYGFIPLVHAWKVSKYRVISGLYFRTRNNTVFGHFSRSDIFFISVEAQKCWIKALLPVNRRLNVLVLVFR